MMTTSIGFRVATAFVFALDCGSLAACASGGQGQPGQSDGDGAVNPGTADGGAGGGNAVDSGAGSDAPPVGIDAPGSSNADASNDSSVPDTGHPAIDSGGPSEGGRTGEGGPTGWSCPPGPFGTPIPAGAAVAKVAGVPPSDAFNNTLFNYTTVEGPVWIGDALYVSEYPGGSKPPSRILKVVPSGAVTVAVADSGSNGLAVDKNGNLYGAIHGDGSISRFDLSTGMRMLPAIVSAYMGNPFDSPNDLAIRSDGTIYFSDPNYHAPNPNPQMATRAYRFSPSTQALAVIDPALTQQPNGVTFSPDESTLYVSANDGIRKYAVMPDGSIGAGSPFPPSPGPMLNVDGMVVDCAGNLYCAVINSANIVVLSPTGVQIGTIMATTSGYVTNVAFGGADRKTLYITTQGSSGGQGLFQIALSIPGMPY